MKSKKTLLLIIFLQSIFFCVTAQDNEIRFKLVDGMNGEPLGKITSMTQDLQGYMWFASQTDKCIYRYDGAHLISFLHDNLNENSLGGADVYDIFADVKGFIWIGYHGQGLDQFNPVTGVFKHYLHADGDLTSLADNVVNSILRDHQGRLWVGTYKGLDLLDERTGKFTHFRNEPKNPRSLSSNAVCKIYEDHQGVIWIGTGYPFFNYEPSDGGLNRLEANGTFTRFMHNPNDPHTLINNKVWSIFEDSRGVFWVGTSKNGLQTLDRKNGLVQRYPYDPSRPDKLSAPPLKPDDWSRTNDLVTFITEDRLGSIWIGTMLAGINRYDPILKKTTHFESSNGFPSGTAWNAFVSRDSVL